MDAHTCIASEESVEDVDHVTYHCPRFNDEANVSGNGKTTPETTAEATLLCA